MWIAVNKDGRPKLFEMPPKRFHEGPTLSPELVGFNNAISIGNDEYSFWAVQEFYDSNRIDDRKHLGYNIMTENEEEGHKVWYSYIPKCVENMTWEDEPIEIEISLRPQNRWKPSDEHYELEEFAKIARSNLTGISKDVQELFEAKYLQLTGNKMYRGYKD